MNQIHVSIFILLRTFILDLFFFYLIYFYILLRNRHIEFFSLLNKYLYNLKRVQIKIENCLLLTLLKFFFFLKKKSNKSRNN